MKKNVIVGQSGGPTAVINASLYGVVYEALNREETLGTVYGMINGIEGFLNNQLMDMKPLELSGELELDQRPPPDLTSVPAATNCRRICRMKSIRNYLKNLPNTTSAISSTSAEMILWIRSASFPDMQKQSEATSVSSVFRRRLTTTLF